MPLCLQQTRSTIDVNQWGSESRRYWWENHGIHGFSYGSLGIDGEGCESAPFTNFTIKTIYGMQNNNWIQLLFRIP